MTNPTVIETVTTTLVVQETAPAGIVEVVAVGPQGPAGPAGPQGLQGENGEDGDITPEALAARDAAQAAATSASGSATSATTSASAAATSATTASSAAASASGSASQATTSANSALGAATTATTKANEASISASGAATSAQTAVTKASEVTASVTSAAASAVSAGSDATAAAASASSAGASATTAANQATSAQTSATNAAASATTATTKASEASTSAGNAATSATAAGTSATNAATSATAAAGSATAASTSATGAASSASTATTQAGIATTKAGEAASSATTATTKASEAVTSATGAAASATTASTKAAEASTSASNAAGSASQADGSALAAAGSATAASSSATAAAASQSAAAGSVTTASTQAGIATTKASEAATSATNAALSAGTATTKASESATSATNAAGSATTASNKASEALTSAGNAATSATNADASAIAAVASATAAAGSEAGALTNANAAQASETAAAGQASTATTQAGIATTKASEAATSASNAAASESTATAKASEASSSATAAASARTAAESARDQTLAAFDSFDDRYLGQKSSDPTVDNDGNALVGGALYFNSSPMGSGGGMKVYDATSSAWLAAYASLSGALLSANNLSDLASTSAARTNLGLDNVENKSSATIRGELTTGNVTDALGFTPADVASLSTVATSGSYTDLTDKPTLFSGAYAELTGKPSLFSGSYADLSNKPNLFGGSYNDLTDKPSLFSGSYLDLSNTPTLFSGAYADLTGKPTLFSGAYGDLTGAPTNVSAFTNDAAYLTGITSSQITTALGFTPYNAASLSGALAPYLQSATASSTYQTIAGMSDYLTTAAAATTYQPVGSYLTSINSSQVTTALGFTPYNATNPSAFIDASALAPYITAASAASTYQPVGAYLTAITSNLVTAALGFTPYDDTNPDAFIDASALAPYLTSASAASTYQPIGAYLTGITSSQVTTALGFTPYNSTNPDAFIDASALVPYITAATAASTYQPVGAYLTGITSSLVTTALGFTPYDSTNPNAFIDASALTPYLTSATAASTYQPVGAYLTGITSSQVTTALGFTPYDSTNPDAFIDASALAPYLTSATAAATYQPIGAYLTGINSSQVTTALGFTPANKAGDTFSGNVLINTGADSRVLLQSSGTTQAQFQTTGSVVRLASNNALPLYLSTNGVDRVALDSNGNITFGSAFTSGVVKIQGLNGGDLFVVESTDASATAAPDVVLYRSSESPAAADQVGNLIFRGKNSGGTNQNYARILATIVDPTSGTETGDLRFGIQTTSGFNDYMTLNSTSLDVTSRVTTNRLAERKTALSGTAIDLSGNSAFTKTISASTTFTVTNPSANGLVTSFVLELVDAGAYVITWWSGITWANGTVPSLTSAGKDVLGFMSHDGGTTWTGFVLGKDVR